MSLIDLSSWIMMFVLVPLYAFSFVFGLIGLIAMGVFCDRPGKKDIPKITKRIIIICLTLTFISTILVSLPSHDRLFKFKISKMKNEMLTETNVTNGIERIDAIAKKLECKYLEICPKEEDDNN